MSVTITLPFGGETLSSFDPSSNSVVEVTGAGRFNATYSLCALNVPPGNTASSPVWAAQTPFWTRYAINQGFLPFDPISNDFHLDFMDGATVVARVLVSGNTSMTFNFYTLQGSLTLVSSFTLALFEAGPQVFDVGLVAGASGSLTVAVNGSLKFSIGSLNHSGWSGVTQVVHRAFGDTFGNSTGCDWSMVIYNTSSTVGQFLYHPALDTNSATNTGWTGGVGNINELPTSDATVISAGSANLVSTFYKNGWSLAGNMLGLIVAARQEVTGAGPTHIEMAIRDAGTNYFSPSIAATSLFAACGYCWTTDPATGLQWGSSALAACEAGAKSIA